MSRLLRATTLALGLGLAGIAGCERPPVSTNKDVEGVSKEGKGTLSLTIEDPTAKKTEKKKEPEKKPEAKEPDKKPDAREPEKK
jgi:hypothetical protein